MSKAVLFAAGALKTGSAWLQEQYRAAGLVIAVDGGLAHALAAGLTPDLLVGDLDSVSPASLELASAVPKQVHPSDKDLTDLELALLEARARGAAELLLAGALGDRADHSLANLLLAARLRQEQQLRVCLAGAGTLAWPLAAGDRLFLPCPAGATFSLLALSTGCRVSVSGARYPLAGADLPFGSGLGVSNISTGETTVQTERGLLVAMVNDDAV